jgi:hypothetical protein
MDAQRNEWEYLVLSLKTDSTDDMEARLNALGSGGWELVAVTSNRPNSNLIYLKRSRQSLPPRSTPPGA